MLGGGGGALFTRGTLSGGRDTLGGGGGAARRVDGGATKRLEIGPEAGGRNGLSDERFFVSSGKSASSRDGLSWDGAD
jgi:hypothetical protein